MPEILFENSGLESRLRAGRRRRPLEGGAPNGLGTRRSILQTASEIRESEAEVCVPSWICRASSPSWSRSRPGGKPSRTVCLIPGTDPAKITVGMNGSGPRSTGQREAPSRPFARLAGGVGLAAFLLAASSSSARVARVETREGQSFEGHIRLESNAVLVINAARGWVVRLPTTNLLTITFSPDPDAEAITGTLRESTDQELPAGWQSVNIGRVNQGGEASLTSGIFSVKGAGASIATGCDAFHFVGKPTHNRGEILARVLHARTSHPSAQVGLMVRGSLAADACNFFVGVSPGQKGASQCRAGDGAWTTNLATFRMAPPCWLRLRRNGDQFSAYGSRDGRRWSLLGRADFPMPEACFIGLAVASGWDDHASQVLFDNVREALVIWTGPFTPRVELRSGSVVVGLIRSVDDTAVHFWGSPPRAPVSTLAVSRLLFRWVTPRMAAKIESGRPGVLLANGDFVEGEFRSLEGGRVAISSVTQGLRRFEVEEEVAAVVLRKPAQPWKPYAVKTIEGSTWLGRVAGLGMDEALLQEPALGLCRIPVYELAEVRWAW